MQNFKIDYRPEIDGLRALAVFSVIFYHSEIVLFDKNFFQGGFLGVDIFFVISGYLITSIIIKETVISGSFSFINFYERRIRRILPILFFVMIVSLPFAYFTLLIDQIIEFSKSIISSIFFVSNIFFHYTDDPYIAEASMLKPFLHTWSLSIEEQYYVFFPIIFYFIIKYFKKLIPLILFLGIAMSLYIAEKFSISHPSFNFFMLPSRGFELLIGSFTSYLQFNKNFNSIVSKNSANNFLSLIGLILVIYPLFYFNDEMLLPSIKSLVPVLGISLMIVFGRGKVFVNKILCNKIIVFLGLISYSLYIWHYPIFAFSKNLYLFQGSNLTKSLFILFTILLSIFSYFYLEKPFRNKNIISTYILKIFIGSSIIVLLIFSIFIISKDGYKNRLPKIFHEKLINTHKIMLNKNGTNGDVVLIGDSHIQPLSLYLNDYLKEKKLNFHRHFTPLYVHEFHLVDSNGRIDYDFDERNNNIIYKLFKEKQNLTIILHHRWSYFLTEKGFNNTEVFPEYTKSQNYIEPISKKDQRFTKKTLDVQERQIYLLDGIKLAIENIIELGHKLIIVYPVPEVGFEVPRYYLKKYLFDLNNEPIILSTDFNLYRKRHEKIFEILDNIKHKNVFKVYPHRHFCNKKIANRCIVNSLDELFYQDDDHLSLQGSKFIINDIKNIIEKTSK